MLICFWCRRPKDEKDKDTKEICYKPCMTCLRLMSKGYPVAEFTKKPYLNQKPLSDNIYPTGVWCVIPENEALEILGKEIYNNIPKDSDIIFLDMNQYRTTGLHPRFKDLH